WLLDILSNAAISGRLTNSSRETERLFGEVSYASNISGTPGKHYSARELARPTSFFTLFCDSFKDLFKSCTNNLIDITSRKRICLLVDSNRNVFCFFAAGRNSVRKLHFVGNLRISLKSNRQIISNIDSASRNDCRILQVTFFVDGHAGRRATDINDGNTIFELLL